MIMHTIACHSASVGMAAIIVYEKLLYKAPCVTHRRLAACIKTHGLSSHLVNGTCVLGLLHKLDAGAHQWVVTLAQAILGVQSAPAQQRPAVASTLERLARSMPIMTSDLQACSSLACIQLLTSATS